MRLQSGASKTLYHAEDLLQENTAAAAVATAAGATIAQGSSSSSKADENFIWGQGAGLGAPLNSGGGVVKRGSNGHKRISSMQMSEKFGSNFLGGGVRDASHPP